MRSPYENHEDYLKKCNPLETFKMIEGKVEVDGNLYEPAFYEGVNEVAVGWAHLTRPSGEPFEREKIDKKLPRVGDYIDTGMGPGIVVGYGVSFQQILPSVQLEVPRRGIDGNVQWITNVVSGEMNFLKQKGERNLTGFSTSGVGLNVSCRQEFLARAIHGRGDMEFMHDRKAHNFVEGEKGEEFINWINNAGIKVINNWKRKTHLEGISEKIGFYRDEFAGYFIAATPNRSHGYIYVQALDLNEHVYVPPPLAKYPQNYMDRFEWIGQYL